MKKTFLLLTLSLLFSCAGYMQTASNAADKTYIGMPVNEFKKMTGQTSKLAAMESGYTVYQMNDRDPYYGQITDVKFFYFDSSGKLYKIDKGEFRQNRYQVEVINK